MFLMDMAFIQDKTLIKLVMLDSNSCLLPQATSSPSPQVKITMLPFGRMELFWLGEIIPRVNAQFPKI